MDRKRNVLWTKRNKRKYSHTHTNVHNDSNSIVKSDLLLVSTIFV